MILSIINYVLAACVAAVGFLSFVRGTGDAFEGLEFLGVALPLCVLVFILWKVFRTPTVRLGPHYFLWPIALVLAFKAIFTSTGMDDAYIALLTVSVLLSAIVRAEPVWVIVFVATAVSYSAQAVMGAENSEMDIAFFIKMGGFWGMTLFAGLIPWIVLKKRGEAQDAEFNKTLEEVRNNAITDAMARAKTLSQDAKKGADQTGTASLTSANTIRMDASSTDTLSLLSVGGDEANAQLQSMLFFMRYNFKSLTAATFIYDPGKRVLVLNCYDTKGTVQVINGAQIHFGAGVIGQVAAEKKLFMSGDLSLYQAGDQEHSFYAQPQNTGVCSILAAPIAYNNEFLGVLVVDSTNKNAFTEHDKELMKRFSTIAAALIVNIRMNQSLDQAAKTFRIFYEVSHHFSVALKMEDIYKAAVDMVPRLIPSCVRQIIILHDPEKPSLRMEHIAGTKGELAEGMEFPPDAGGIYSYVFNRNCAVNIPDLQAQRSYRFVPQETPNPTVRSLLVIPIIGGENHKCIGLYSVETNVPGAIKGAEEQQLTTIIENASVAITRSQLFLKMEKLATTDGLTGLNNHRTFQEIITREFERARRYNHPLSVLLTDIDHFKSFNDTYGHPVGDLVLREIAACIRRTVRLNDFPARYGGEEFAVILPETPEQGALIIAERIRQAVEACVIQSGENSLRVTISIGCVSFPTFGTSTQELIDSADKALYASKRGGRNRVTIYNPQMAHLK